MKQAFNGFANAVIQSNLMETGDTEWYIRKIHKHVDLENEDKVVLYLSVYCSFHEVEKTSAREKFDFALEFLKSRGIRGKIKPARDTGAGEEHYKQVLFIKGDQPLRMSHYPNGYDHYFGEF